MDSWSLTINMGILDSGGTTKRRAMDHTSTRMDRDMKVDGRETKSTVLELTDIGMEIVSMANGVKTTVTDKVS